MELMRRNPRLSAYLASGEAIDHRHPLVRETSARLKSGVDGACSYAKRAFEFVRDGIVHSHDSGDLRVTWRASDVLEQGHGLCYAKAHALAALLRAESIPAALCYQRLADDDGAHPVLHGLVAVLLPGARGWVRQDPRGGEPGAGARFSVEGDCLPFVVRPECNEVDYPVLYDEPHPKVLGALRTAPDRPHLWKTLPAEL